MHSQTTITNSLTIVVSTRLALGDAWLVHADRQTDRLMLEWLISDSFVHLLVQVFVHPRKTIWLELGEQLLALCDQIFANANERNPLYLHG